MFLFAYHFLLTLCYESCWTSNNDNYVPFKQILFSITGAGSKIPCQSMMCDYFYSSRGSMHCIGKYLSNVEARKRYIRMGKSIFRWHFSWWIGWNVWIGKDFKALKFTLIPSVRFQSNFFALDFLQNFSMGSCDDWQIIVSQGNNLYFR